MLETTQNKEENTNPIDLGPLSDVIRRDGERIAFDASRIVAAIAKAGEATTEFGSEEAWLLTQQVVKVLKYRFSNTIAPNIEQIQDVVEQVLISSNYYKTARAYIVYREQREKARKDKRALFQRIKSRI